MFASFLTFASKTRRVFLPLVLTILTQPTLPGEDHKDRIADSIERNRSTYEEIARDIWRLAEVGYQEKKSSALLQDHLRQSGFVVNVGVAEIPTAFVASYGEGKPVIGFVAEFDALPGLSQDAVPQRKPLVNGAAGHACGHNLLGTGSLAAAIAVKEWLDATGTSGTVRLYGTPAEEGGAGKVYMVRAGLFDDVDAVLEWHPSSRNFAGPRVSTANRSAKFRFYGSSAHAAGAPHRARSALDGVESMNYMVNLMREHVPSGARIHYVITNGGAAPNVVPNFAEVYYYVRHHDPRVLIQIWERILKAAEGAALGTGTRFEYEIIHGVYSRLPNETLARLMDANLRHVGGVTYTDEERTFARKLRQGMIGNLQELGSEEQIQAYEVQTRYGSSDMGDVSWTVPTAGLQTAAFVPGTPGHSWQAVAASGTSVGIKGALVAAKTLAITAVDLYSGPSVLEKAQTEFENRRGPDFRYEPLLGDRDPPLDYRANAR